MRRRSGPRSGRKYPRKAAWLKQRDACYARAKANCEVSGESLGHWGPPNHAGYLPWKWRRACDHVIPERWVRRFCAGANPHIIENLAAVTPRIHAKKTAIEWRLFRGDMLGFKSELRKIGYPDEMVTRALKALIASAKENERLAHAKVRRKALPAQIPGHTATISEA